MTKELKSKLEEFIDQLETEYGDLEGFEVRLEHPVVEGFRETVAEIKEFIIYRIHKTEIDL
jgi:hypothetical protein